MTTTDLPPEATLPPRVRLTIGSDAPAEDRPDHPRASLVAMQKHWELPDLLMGGTPAMHEAGTKVLQKEAKETDEEFRVRITRGVLTNYYRDTIDRHSGLPFRTPIVFDPPLPDRMRYLETNADGAGRSITVLAREAMRSGMHHGLTHFLVDAAPADPESSSLRDDMNRRPLLLHVEASDMLDAWDQPSAQDDGESQVLYTRIAQKRLVESGKFGKVEEDVVLEIDADAKAATTWAKTKDGGFDGEAFPYLLDSIPLFTFYTLQTGSYAALPAYQPLAELNLAHFQSDCEQRHGLSYGRRGTLLMTGWKQPTGPADAAAKGEAAPKEITLGWARKIQNSAPDADARFLETSGAGLAAGQVDLTELEKRMERFGAAQLSKSGGITATSRALDDKRDNCNLEAWCTRLEGRILAAVRAIAEWMQQPLPANQKLTFDRSFAEDPTAGQTDLPYLIQLAEKSMLPRAVLLDELRARKVLRTSATNDELIAMLAEEEDKFAEASMEALAKAQVAARAQDPMQPPPQQNAPPFGGGQPQGGPQ